MLVTRNKFVIRVKQKKMKKNTMQTTTLRDYHVVGLCEQNRFVINVKGSIHCFFALWQNSSNRVHTISL